MILLITNKRDITTDFVVLELRRRGLPFHRLNTEDLPAAHPSFRPEAGWTIGAGDDRIALGAVRSAYYRRPAAPSGGWDPADASVATYCSDEWAYALQSLTTALDGAWLSRPTDIMLAEDKPRQLALAASIGFAVPETLVTNDFDEASAFVAEGGCVVKPLRHALVDDRTAGSVIFTNRLDRLDEADRTSFEMAPVILQREIRKESDLRVTVVGDKVFATRIGSQDTTQTEVDWRRGSDPDMEQQAVDIPSTLAEACVRLTAALGLRFGAIDLVRDRHGEHWFLEINPNGQWAWIEQRTGHPITSAIVDLLERRHDAA